MLESTMLFDWVDGGLYGFAEVLEVLVVGVGAVGCLTGATWSSGS